MDWSKIRWNIFTILLTLINPVANRSCKSCFRSWFWNPDQLSWSESDCPEGKAERDKFWENSFCNLGELGSKSLGYYSDEHRGNNFAHEVVSIEVNILPRMCFVDIKSNHNFYLNFQRKKPPSYFKTLLDILKVLINFFYGDRLPQVSKKHIFVLVHGRPQWVAVGYWIFKY